MREEFVLFIWKYQYFNRKKLATTTSEKLDVITIGRENKNTGPDFFNAQIVIDNQKWAGTVELHVKASDWYIHGHENDVNYDNVILHVVWENDVPVYRKNNTIIPTLELKNIVDSDLVVNYRTLFSNKIKWINCEATIASVDKFTKDNWLERLYIERLEQKARSIVVLAKQSNNDWEEVLYKLLLKNFGLKVNAAAFVAISNVLEYSIIRKECHSLERLEALLFGSAGLLDRPIENAYFKKLEKEYKHLAIKYKLLTSTMNVAFFRLRPNNFPTIRLAQFARLYHKNKSLFSKLITTKDLNYIYELLSVTVSEFWSTHYTFESSSKKSQKKLSKKFIDLLLINTIIPLQFVYQKYIGKPDNALIFKMIRTIPSEDNTIIQTFGELNIGSDSALSSQALLQLKKEYCDKKNCLKCAIGNKILTNIRKC